MLTPIPLNKVHRLINFGPIMLITTKYKGKANIMPIAWSMPVDFYPPLVAVCIGDESYTFKIVKKTNEFVINIPSKKMINLVYDTGHCSGKDIDKFEKFNIKTFPSKYVDAPSLVGAIAILECKVINKKLANNHNIFIAKVVNALAEKGSFNDIFQAQNKKFKPLIHLGEKFFTTLNGIIKVK